MRFVWAIFKRELKSYLVSPLTYAAVAVFVAIQGLLFIAQLGTFQQMRLQLANNPLAEMPGVEMLVREQLGSDLIWVLIAILPLLTMRLLAEEKKQHTAELLLTAPIKTGHLVLGKYFGAVAVLVVMLICTSWMPGALYLWGQPDPAPLVTGYLGAFLYGSLMVAIGLMASGLTESVMLAAFVSFCAMMLTNFLGLNAGAIPIIGEELDMFTPSTNLSLLAQGVINTRAIVFFVSLIALMLFMTSRVVDSQRWR